jgi:hypothetical protein
VVIKVTGGERREARQVRAVMLIVGCWMWVCGCECPVWCE